MVRFLPLFLILLLTACTSEAQDNAADEMGDMTIEEFEPTSTLVVDENLVTAAKFPFVDVHSHHWRAATMSAGAVDTLIMEMDAMNMAVIVNLSGRSGEALLQAVENMEGRYPNRVVTFANIDFEGFGTEEWTKNAVAQLRADIEAGARGLKIFKNLGMDVVDTNGNRVPVNDTRMDPVWALAGEMGIPVLIHSADPPNFWKPRDKHNEKWLELKLRPNRYRDPATNPSFEQIMDEHFDIMRKHRGTTFISAHMSWMSNDLDALASKLDEHPNMVTEMGAIIYELGRQPRKAKEFLTEYKDRVMMGKDSYNPDEFHTYFRTYETEDEYFPYYRKYHAQWRLYGIGLSDDVLQHIYYKTAMSVIPGLDASLFE